MAHNDTHVKVTVKSHADAKTQTPSEAWGQDQDPDQSNTWHMFIKVMFKKPTTFLTTLAGVLSLVQATLTAANVSKWASLVLGLVAGIAGLLATTFAHSVEMKVKKLGFDNQKLQQKNDDYKKRKQDRMAQVTQLLSTRTAAPVAAQAGAAPAAAATPPQHLQEVLSAILQTDYAPPASPFTFDGTSLGAV